MKNRTLGLAVSSKLTIKNPIAKGDLPNFKLKSSKFPKYCKNCGLKISERNQKICETCGSQLD